MQSVLNDHDHPHCHIVYSRVDNNGKTISVAGSAATAILDCPTIF
ncbi:MAG: relaxase/mobilization nuclease domain-containing protein [Duncaniella sp.]|nr:relaxase/mobilization nuclease domain-containing protein [Duncaniella sp.]